MLTVHVPNRTPELQYTIDYLCGQIWGLTYQVQSHDHSTLDFISGDKSLRLALKDWKSFRSPTSTVFAPEGLVLFDGPARLDITKEASQILIDYDFLYYTFLILSRYEETVSGPLDPHQRFPQQRSFLNQECLQRPIVDEYADYLQQILLQDLKVPASAFKKLEYRYQLSMDIDTPRNPDFRNHLSYAKGLLKGRSWSERRLLGNSAYFIEDDYYNYPEIIAQWDVRKHHPKIFVIADHTHKLDGFYNISDASIDWLFKEARTRGIGVGVHGSYNSFADKKQLAKEKKLVEDAVSETVIDVRQHFLRFDVAQTYSAQENAGFQRDWSLGFAEHVGFRAGTSRPFRPYGFAVQRALNIVEEPLLVMDASLGEEKYMGLTNKEELVAAAQPIHQACVKHQGHFNILFHNTYLRSAPMHQFFQEALTW